MLKKIILISAVCLVGLSLSSCVQPAPPKAEFLEYKVVGLSAQGLEVNFFFNFENPNPIPLDIVKYKYQVYINNQILLDEEREGFNLPGSGKKLVKIPVFINFANLFGTVNSVLQLINTGVDSVDYRIEGELTAGALGVKIHTPIKASGKIPIPQDLNL